jgi:T-complex protein 1 subunit theta
MAHVLARHSAEAITTQLLFLPITFGLALLFETGTDVFHSLLDLMVALPGSRANESEADHVGMHLAAHACFEPEGMVSMLQVRCHHSGS